MNSDPLYRSFKAVVQKYRLESCFAAKAYDPKIERVFREVNQLLGSEEIQRRLREKRGCA